MTFELRPHRDSYDLNAPFEVFVPRTQLLRAARTNREHCWLELSSLARMLAQLCGARAGWSISVQDELVRQLQAAPALPGVTLSVLPDAARGPVLVFDCTPAPLPCIVPGYDAVIARLRARRDPFWQDF